MEVEDEHMKIEHPCSSKKKQASDWGMETAPRACITEKQKYILFRAAVAWNGLMAQAKGKLAEQANITFPPI